MNEDVANEEGMEELSRDVSVKFASPHPHSTPAKKNKPIQHL
jgi:hypothetical protein